MAVLRDYVMNRQERLSYMVERYQTTILKVCYAYLCNLEDAKDAVQETFLKAYSNLDSFRGECSEKSWLIRIARNTCLDMRRSAWYRRVDQPRGFFVVMDAHTGEVLKVTERNVGTGIQDLV